MPDFIFIIAPDGTRLRTATFKRSQGSKPQGVCVLLGGRSEFIEKYQEVIKELCERGFDVATFDWRGQGGSQRALANPILGHVIDFAQFDTDLKSFMHQIVKPMSTMPPLVLAHSMGGHLTLRALRNEPKIFRAAVLSAPMIDVHGRGKARLLIPIMRALGRSESPVLSEKESDPLNVPFEKNLLTSDRSRFLRNVSLIRETPTIRLGSPTWGWLRAANDSINHLLARGYLESISTPILVCGAAADRICVTTAAQGLADRLPNGTYVEFEGSEHEILMENDKIRSRFWNAFDEFVTSLG